MGKNLIFKFQKFIDTLEKDFKRKVTLKEIRERVKKETGIEIHPRTLRNYLNGTSNKTLMEIGAICCSYNKNPNDYLMVETIAWRKLINKKILSGTIQQDIRWYIKENGSITSQKAKELIRLKYMDISDYRVMSEIKMMVKKGILTKEKDKKSAYYILTQAFPIAA